MVKARIVGLGSYLPEKILTNQELEGMVETSDEWIVSRTGIQERRIASTAEHTSTMGVLAAREALERSGKKFEEIDLVIAATMTPDYLIPSTAALIQSELKLPGAAAFDMQAACTGFIYGLSLAKAYIESGIYRNILLVASEKMSSFIDYKDRNTCVIFGDGAASAVISSEGKGLSIDAINVGADGSLGHLIIIPSGGSRLPATDKTIEEKGHFIKMEGKEVFKHAVRRMGSAIEECLKTAGLKESDINWLIPHQANSRIIDAIGKACKIDASKVYMTLHKYGNTSGSSVGIALNELTQAHEIQNNDHLLLAAFGAGLTWGAALLTQGES